jgi:hypothetical protein
MWAPQRQGVKISDVVWTERPRFKRTPHEGKMYEGNSHAGLCTQRIHQNNAQADGNLQSSGERLPNTGTTTKISPAIIAKRR